MYLKLANRQTTITSQQLDKKSINIRAHFNTFVIELSRQMVEEFYLSPSNNNQIATIINNN